MEYRTLGHTGLTVSRFCLGTLTFGQSQWGCDEREAGRIVGAFRDRGGNFIDTADTYNGGAAEAILGRVIAGPGRDELVIATKVGLPTGSEPNALGLSRKHIVASVDACLRRLGTDYVDVVQMHAFDSRTPVEETLAALDAVVSAGKARYAGASNFFAWQLADMHRLARSTAAIPIISVQLMYSLVRRDAEREHFDLCAAREIGLLAYSPLHGGVLALPPSDHGGRAHSLRTAGNPDLNTVYLPDSDRITEIANAVADIAKVCGTSMSTIALSWVLSRPVTAVIIGAQSVEQLSENMSAAHTSLDEASVLKLEAASRPPHSYPADFYARLPSTVRYAQSEHQPSQPGVDP